MLGFNEFYLVNFHCWMIVYKEKLLWLFKINFEESYSKKICSFPLENTLIGIFVSTSSQKQKKIR